MEVREERRPLLQASRNGGYNGRSLLTSDSTVDPFNWMPDNVGKMNDRHVTFHRIEEGQVRDDTEVVPRICVGMMIVVCLILLLALVVSVVDWELTNFEFGPILNSTSRTVNHSKEHNFLGS